MKRFKRVSFFCSLLLAGCLLLGGCAQEVSSSQPSSSKVMSSQVAVSETSSSETSSSEVSSSSEASSSEVSSSEASSSRASSEAVPSAGSEPSTWETLVDAIAKLENGAFVLSDLPWASSFAQVQEILGTQQDQWAVMENTSDGMVTTTVRRTVPVSVSQPEVSLMEEYRFANDQLYSRRLMLFVAKQGMEQTQQGQGQPIVFGGVSYSAPLAPEDQWEDICDTLAQQVQQAYGDPNSGTVEDIRSASPMGVIWWGSDQSQVNIMFTNTSPQMPRLIDITVTNTSFLPQPEGGPLG